MLKNIEKQARVVRAENDKLAKIIKQFKDNCFILKRGTIYQNNKGRAIFNGIEVKRVNRKKDKFYVVLFWEKIKNYKYDEDFNICNFCNFQAIHKLQKVDKNEKM